MKYTKGNVLNMTTAQPGWRVVLRIIEGEELMVIQDVIGWATVVTWVGEGDEVGEFNTRVEPMFVFEGNGIISAHEIWEEVRVMEILQPGDSPHTDGALTWAQHNDREELKALDDDGVLLARNGRRRSR